MKKTVFLYIFLISGFYVGFLQSQSLVLIDHNSGEPIEGVYYVYGEESGITGKSGEISIQLIDNESLILFDIRYGQIILNEQQILLALEEGKRKLRSRVHDLLPVTVVSIHSPLISGQEREMGTVDRLNHDGADILNNISGFSSIRKSAAFGFDPVFRGFKNEQLNIVIDGVQSCLAACPNRMDPPSSQISPNMMEKIEILKGPHSLRYGNSFGGTINFISAGPTFSDETRIGGRVASGFETNGEVLKTEARLNLQSSNWNVSLFGALATGNDYRDGEGMDVAANFERLSLGASIHYRLNNRQQLSFSATRNSARDVDFPALGMDLRKDDTWLLNLNHLAEFEGGSLKSIHTTVFGSFVEHLMDNLLKPLEPRMVNASTPAETTVIGGRTETAWNLKSGFLWAGADLRRESASGSRQREFLMGPNQGRKFIDPAWQDGSISKLAIFGEYRRSLDNYSFILSSRLEFNDAGIDEVNEDFEQWYDESSVTDINPSFSAGVRKYWSQNFSTGLWLGRAQRSGSLTERFIHFLPVGSDPFELLGNPELKPEKIHQADLNLHFSNGNHQLSGDIFVADIRDFISAKVREDIQPSLPSAPGVRQFTNISRAFKTGFELHWKHSLNSKFSQQLSMAYTYAKDMDNNEPLAEIPPMEVQYKLMGQFLNQRLQPSVGLRHAMKQDRVSTEFGEQKTPGFTVLDINIGYEVSNSITLGMELSNALDEAYYEHLSRSIRAMDNRPVYSRGRSFNFYAAWRF